MKIIMNSTERAKELEDNIENAAVNLELSSDNTPRACVNVPAEENCDNCYAEGQRLAVNLQAHIAKASSYMQQINDTIEQADQAAALRVWSLNP